MVEHKEERDGQEEGERGRSRRRRGKSRRRRETDRRRRGREEQKEEGEEQQEKKSTAKAGLGDYSSLSHASRPWAHRHPGEAG